MLANAEWLAAANAKEVATASVPVMNAFVRLAFSLLFLLLPLVQVICCSRVVKMLERMLTDLY